jgi:hypothetical protein
MADRDTGTRSNSPSSENVLPEDDVCVQSLEPDGKKVVPFPQQENSELELRKIEIERKRLELEKEKFLFEQEKAKAEIELKRIKNEAEIESTRSIMQLEDLRDDQGIARREQIESKKYQRQQSNHSYWFKMVVSTVMISSGIWLISKGDNLGPYLLGTGAGGAGIQSASELMQRQKKEDLESSVSDLHKDTELGA